jgi:hypothetical protein
MTAIVLRTARQLDLTLSKEVATEVQHSSMVRPESQSPMSIGYGTIRWPTGAAMTANPRGMPS